MACFDCKYNCSNIRQIRDKLIEDLLNELPVTSRLRIEELIHDVGDEYRKIQLLRLYSKEQKECSKGLGNG